MPHSFSANMRTAAIGSLPLTDAEEACRMVLDGGIDIPFWPQLPKRDFRELMIPQYSEGMPCVRIDESEKRIWFEIGESKSDEIMACYEKLMAGDPSQFKMSPHYARGLYAFLDMATASGQKFDCIKGHITGPLTFTFGVTDQERKAIYYDFELQDAATKCLAQKAVWQVQQLQPLAEKVVIFIDEPVLAAFGTSAYLSLKGEDVIRLLDEVVDAVKPTGALVGCHCCGNTDWSVLSRTKLDFISFDAFEYAQSVSLYPDDIKAYLGRGGILAWGVVPTKPTEAIRSETTDSLEQRLLEGFGFLESKGVPRETLIAQGLLTPSCGTGPMEPGDSKKVFAELVALGKRIQDGL
ncbi:MAG: hypothetical protein GXP25_13380 [Planctomycetes bacterium]|nr:hypothetical protein [Planctomycetota bacterium]